MSEQTGEAYQQYDDEGILPDDIDRPLGVLAHGTTADEMEEGASLEDRVNAEIPDDAVLSDDVDQPAESAAMHEI